MCTVKHFVFNSLGLTLFPPVLASLAAKRLVVWREQIQPLCQGLLYEVEITFQRDPLSHGVSSSKNMISEPTKVIARNFHP